ncbi:MAG: exodeoxyribonuclease VII large subunit [Candidatus Saccharimonadales bacterium]
MQEYVFGVSEFVMSLNATLEGAFPYVEIEGELANFRVSKGKWVYFDLKDEDSTIKCFATIYSLPGPLEDGMVVRVAGTPRLHQLYNFSFQVQSIVPIGEGALKRANDLLALKLQKEGLFDEARKRPLPYPPKHIAVITSAQSAAYADFIKITSARWQAMTVDVYDVLVQGINAPGALVGALQRINAEPELPELVVMIRGGGSPEDLAAFSDERVVRAVSASRVPTLVAIGHEVDVSLAELAADKRASTPSNAAELLTPDKTTEKRHVRSLRKALTENITQTILTELQMVSVLRKDLGSARAYIYRSAVEALAAKTKMLAVLDPQRPLQQGYAIVRDNAGKTVLSGRQVHSGDALAIQFKDAVVQAEVKRKGATT